MVDGSVIGSMVGVVFGGLWSLAGATGLPAKQRCRALFVSIAVPVILVLLLARQGRAQTHATFRSDVYGTAVAFESVAIVIIVPVLHRLRRQALIPPAIGLIVGLHFLGLWRATLLPLFLWTAIGMCGACLLAATAPVRHRREDHARRAWTGFGCAIVLWASCIATLF